MVKRILSTKKPKKPRVTRTEAYFINLKHMGPEPEPNPLDQSVSTYAANLNWYNCMSSLDEARQYLTDYLMDHNRTTEARLLHHVPDKWLNTTICWIARMWDRNHILPESATPFFEAKLQETLSYSEEEKVEKETTGPSSKLYGTLCEVEGLLDAYLFGDGKEFDLYDWFNCNGIPSTHARAIAEKYRPWLDDLISAWDREDPQLSEAYRHLSRPQLKSRIIFFNRFITDAEKYGEVTKIVKKSRNPKPMTTEKLLKNFKYQKKDDTFKISSVAPERILHASELWTFNTKYKTLSVFRAANDSGLTIRNTSIENFNEETSHTYYTARKTESLVDSVLKSGKIQLRKIGEELSTRDLQKRINENIILLRVVQ